MRRSRTTKDENGELASNPRIHGDQASKLLALHFQDRQHGQGPTTRNEWVRDPALTRAGLEQFLTDKGNIGRLYLDRYLVCPTSGTTGTPAILVQDPVMMNVTRLNWDEVLT